MRVYIYHKEAVLACAPIILYLIMFLCHQKQTTLQNAIHLFRIIVQLHPSRSLSNQEKRKEKKNRQKAKSIHTFRNQTIIAVVIIIIIITVVPREM